MEYVRDDQQRIRSQSDSIEIEYVRYDQQRIRSQWSEEGDSPIFASSLRSEWGYFPHF